MSPAPGNPTTAAHLVVGLERFPIEADRIHVIGSGERADIRIVHASIAKTHATVCAHDGRLILEDLGTESGTWIGEERVKGEREIGSGTALRLGAIPICLAWTGPATLRSPSPVRHADPGFGELMAEELRRAPWFGLSALLHVALFFVLYILMPAREPERGVARIEFSDGDRFAEDYVDDGTVEPEIEVLETPDPFDQLPPDPFPDPELAPVAIDEAMDSRPAPMAGNVELGASLFTRIGGGSRSGDLLSGRGGGSLPTGFRRAVAGLRESGLEIVFVLDSTGSMGPVLDATKRRMTRMLEALHGLVPDARIGVVTYRDRGPTEQYVTRSIEIGADLYRAINFVQTLSAGGGGDRPEGVLEGLRTAIDQRWQPGARRVVVVIGDAPAHMRDENDIERVIRSFVRGSSGFVHSIMTATDLFGEVSGDTKHSFEQIARAGNGLCVTNEREDEILEEVLSLAIGAEHRESVAEVFRILEQRDSRASTRERDAVRRAAAGTIEAQLSATPIDADFVQLLWTSGSRDVAGVLADLLARAEFPATGRNAAAFALQRMLGLSVPPVDPVDPQPISERTLRELRSAAASRLR